MEETPDVTIKYQKLALEYSKLKAQVSVLKTAVTDEQNTVSDLQELLKKKDQLVRKLEQEVECLNFRNLQLSKRVSVLQSDLQVADTTQHSKGKSSGIQSKPISESYNVLNTELQSRIEENERLHQQIYSADLEHGKKVSELSSKIEELQSSLEELEKKSNEKLKEQQILIDTLQKEKIKMQVCIKNNEQELKKLNSSEETKTKSIANENEELNQKLNEMKKVIADNVIFNDKVNENFNALNVPIIQRKKHDQLSTMMLKMQTFVYDFCRQLSDLHTFMIQRLCTSSDSSNDVIVSKLEVCLRESIQQLKVIPLNFESITNAIKAETLTWDKSPVKNFSAAFQRYEKYLDKMLPFLILRIQSKESISTSSPKMIELIPKLVISARKSVACFKKLYKYVQLLSCLGGTERNKYYASQATVVKKILCAIQSLQTIFDDTRKLFGSKIALDHQLPLLSDSEKSTDECILSTLVSISSSSKKIVELMEKNTDIFSWDVWYMPKCYSMDGKMLINPSVWQFKEKGIKYLQQIAQEDVLSIPHEVALKNYQTLCDHADNQENLTQQLEEYQNKLMQLELDKENWMLECELMKVRVSQDSNAKPGSIETKLQDYDEIHSYVKNTVNQLIKQIQFADSKAITYKNECETLHQKLKMNLEKKEVLENEVMKARKEISQLKEEQKTLMQSYDEQLNTMSEHLANLNETLTSQKDEIDALKHSGNNKGKKGKSRLNL